MVYAFAWFPFDTFFVFVCLVEEIINIFLVYYAFAWILPFDTFFLIVCLVEEIINIFLVDYAFAWNPIWYFLPILQLGLELVI
jgi:hypothetical protein